MQIEEGVKVMRVPGGWIYHFESFNGNNETSCFVPYAKAHKFNTYEQITPSQY